MSTTSDTTPGAPAWPGRLMRAGTWGIGGGLALVALAGPLHRFGLLRYPLALLLLVAGVALLGLAALPAIGGLLASVARGPLEPRGLAALAIVAALAVLGLVQWWAFAAAGAPAIHEVSTDLRRRRHSSPCRHRAPAPRRRTRPATGPPPAAGAGAEAGAGAGSEPLDAAEAQRRAYLDLQPLLLAGVAPIAAFVRVERAVRALGGRSPRPYRSRGGWKRATARATSASSTTWSCACAPRAAARASTCARARASRAATRAATRRVRALLARLRDAA
ncbi:MAG: hypothetical protein U1F11_00080 [Steroidobacteraceae bacterium]